MRAALALLALALVLAAPAAGVSASGPPDVLARAVFVQNGSSGEVLLRHRARARVPIASITKLMTVLVTLERARPGDVVTVASGATGIGESAVHLRAGERLTVRDLVKAALIQSANDAAYALAFHVGGSPEAFVRLMNRRARSLGLTDTHFIRPDGLDVAGHVSSARDVTKLARVVMKHPLVRDLVRRPVARIAGGRTLRTWNDLLTTVRGVVGVKTGHTFAAGWSQVAAARGEGVTIYATLLGSPSRGQRNADLRELIRWAVSRYRLVRAVSSDRVYGTVATEYDRAPVPVVATRPLVRSVRVDRPLVERVVVASFVSLPVAKGQRLGEVRVYAGRRLLGRRPLVASAAAQRPGLPSRLAWHAEEAVEQMWGWLT